MVWALDQYKANADLKKNVAKKKGHSSNLKNKLNVSFEEVNELTF